MPRPKGSKNKPKTEAVQAFAGIDEYDARIAAVAAEIDALTEQLKTKKAEQKKLTKSREAAIAAEAERKAAEDKARLMDAIAASGKSVDEILEMLK